MISDNAPEFGHRTPGRRYEPRPGSYALILDAQGRVAVLQTPPGYYLPGGGAEDGETPEATLLREVREECGFVVQITGRVGEAVEYVHSKGHAEGIRKECVFFAASVTADTGSGIEEDHVLVWLDLPEAAERLGHGSQRWAVRRAMAMRGGQTAG